MITIKLLPLVITADVWETVCKYYTQYAKNLLPRKSNFIVPLHETPFLIKKLSIFEDRYGEKIKIVTNPRL